MERVSIAPKNRPIERAQFKKVGLIDADFLKYHVTLDIEKFFKRGGDLIGKYGEDYVYHFTKKKMDEKINSKFSTWGNLYCFSAPSKNTFRFNISLEKKYKGNRKGKDESYPNQFDDMAKVVECVGRHNTVVMYPWLEADDLLSCLQNEYTMIYSYDKDMKQVVGSHYNMDFNRLDEISNEQAACFIAYQLLRGDTGDNIPGFPGMGEKKVALYLKDIRPAKQIQACYDIYIKNFGIFKGTEMFVETWNLVKLRSDRGTYFKETVDVAFRLRDELIKSNKL